MYCMNGIEHHDRGRNRIVLRAICDAESKRLEDVTIVLAIGRVNGRDRRIRDVDASKQTNPGSHLGGREPRGSDDSERHVSPATH